MAVHCTDASDFSVLIVDTETTDLATAGGELIEVAAVLYSVKHRCIVSQVSSLLPVERGCNKAERINQIPVEATCCVPDGFGDAACKGIMSLAQGAKYVIAHNAEFDKDFMGRCKTLAGLCDKLWLCTCYDFEWPKQHRPGMNLVHLALAHGVGVTSAHRALSDCQLVASLFTVLGEGLVSAIARAARPKCRVVAQVDHTEKDKARESGFKWEPANRLWSRWIAIKDLPCLLVKYSVAEVDPRGNNSIMWARLWQMYVSHKAEVKGDVGLHEELGQRVWRMVREVPAMLSSMQTLWKGSWHGSVEPEGLLETMGALETWYWTANSHEWGMQSQAWESRTIEYENWRMHLHDSIDSRSWQSGSNKSVTVGQNCLELSSPGEADVHSDSLETDITEEKAIETPLASCPTGEDEKSTADLVDAISEMSVGSERSSGVGKAITRRKGHRKKYPKQV